MTYPAIPTRTSERSPALTRSDETGWRVSGMIGVDAAEDLRAGAIYIVAHAKQTYKSNEDCDAGYLQRPPN